MAGIDTPTHEDTVTVYKKIGVIDYVNECLKEITAW
jgi:hypothetical protein